jgi:hypothetical protein
VFGHEFTVFRGLAYVLSSGTFSIILGLSRGLTDDFDVQRGNFNKALISWFVFQRNLLTRLLMKYPRYFMLAHGIAHNLVYPHNLEHEFYVSAICEAYLEPLFNLLSDPRQAIK